MTWSHIRIFVWPTRKLSVSKWPIRGQWQRVGVRLGRLEVLWFRHATYGRRYVGRPHIWGP